MIARETFFSMAGVTRLRNRRALRRRLWRETLKGVLIFAAMVGLVVWLWSCVRDGCVASSFALTSFGGLAMAPVTQGAVMGLGAVVLVVGVVLAVRKMRADDVFYASLRREGDIFAPLREGTGPVPAEDALRILVACAAEARCIAKHVRRAQTTLLIDDYGDELAMAEKKIDSVIRCVEALVERMGKGEEMPRFEDPPTVVFAAKTDTAQRVPTMEVRA